MRSSFNQQILVQLKRDYEHAKEIHAEDIRNAKKAITYFYNYLNSVMSGCNGLNTKQKEMLSEKWDDVNDSSYKVMNHSEYIYDSCNDFITFINDVNLATGNK